VQSSGAGPWGGCNIDDKFFTMLIDLIGTKVFKEIQHEIGKDWKIIECDLRMEFEAFKREVGSTIL